jgi:hypothetical protein
MAFSMDKEVSYSITSFQTLTPLQCTRFLMEVISEVCLTTELPLTMNRMLINTILFHSKARLSWINRELG